MLETIFIKFICYFTDQAMFFINKPVFTLFQIIIWNKQIIKMLKKLKIKWKKWVLEVVILKNL